MIGFKIMPRFDAEKFGGVFALVALALVCDEIRREEVAFTEKFSKKS